MCSGCDLENGESTKILQSSNTDFGVYLENAGGTFRFHMTDCVHHTTREIYYCPFCGRRLTK